MKYSDTIPPVYHVGDTLVRGKNSANENFYNIREVEVLKVDYYGRKDFPYKYHVKVLRSSAEYEVGMHLLLITSVADFELKHSDTYEIF